MQWYSWVARLKDVTCSQFYLCAFDAFHSERGIIGSLEKIYSKYVSKLDSEDVHSSGCPLCHRTFDSDRQIAALVSEVSSS